MKKRVVFIIDNLNAGGAEKTLVTLLNKFDLDKYDVTLFLLSKEGTYLDKVDKAINIVYLFNLECNKLSIIVKKALRKILFTLISKSKFVKLNQRIIMSILGKEYDTYVAFMEGISTKIVDLIAPMNKNKIAWVHTDVSKYGWYKKYYKSYQEELNCYSNFNKIICVSNDSQRGFKREYFDSEKVEVIYNILDKKEIIEKSNENISLDGDFKICCVGRLEEEKGQDILINAFSKLRGNNKLYIVGDGSKRESLKKLANNLNLENNVVFIGFDINPYKYIKNSDVVVSSSRNEGFSLFVAESIILKKMVISTKCSGPVEILNNGEYGILINDCDDLATNLNEIIKNKDIIRKYEKLSEERSKIFDEENTLKNIYNIL